MKRTIGAALAALAACAAVSIAAAQSQDSPGRRGAAGP